MPDPNDHDGWMLYGAYGYTARLIVADAARRGLKPVLAGRRGDQLQPLAEEYSLPFRAFDLSDRDSIVEQLADCRAVLNCAGPFSATAGPMIDACIAAGAHYLDITGEIDCIEAAAALDADARQRGVAIIPAVGFDVVPSDCLAAMLHQRLPAATRLTLAFSVPLNPSPGTAKTIAQTGPRGGRVRRDGKIEQVPVAWKSTRIPFREGRRWAMTIPWGDVASAYHSTGIANIEVYTAMPRRQIDRLRWARWLNPLARLGMAQQIARRHIEKNVHGPTATERQIERASLWGRVEDDSGNRVEGTLTTPEAYAITALTALESTCRVLEQAASDRPSECGFRTPSQAFGPEYILKFDNVDVQFSPENR